MTHILLVRHGQNEWVKKNRLAGWIEGVHLNEKGQEQAQQAAQRLAHLPIKAIYSSPVTRCHETAVYLAAPHQLPIIELEEMGEVRYGEWEGAKIEDLAKKKEWYGVQHFPSRFQFPAGETMREVQARAVNALEALSQKHPDEMIIVTSHADVIKLVLAHYLGVHIDLFQRIGLSPASVSVIALTDKGMMRVLRINDDGPIQSPPKPENKDKQEESNEGNNGESH